MNICDTRTGLDATAQAKLWSGQVGPDETGQPSSDVIVYEVYSSIRDGYNPHSSEPSEPSPFSSLAVHYLSQAPLHSCLAHGPGLAPRRHPSPGWACTSWVLCNLAFLGLEFILCVITPSAYIRRRA